MYNCAFPVHGYRVVQSAQSQRVHRTGARTDARVKSNRSACVRRHYKSHELWGNRAVTQRNPMIFVTPLHDWIDGCGFQDVEAVFDYAESVALHIRLSVKRIKTPQQMSFFCSLFIRARSWNYIIDHILVEFCMWSPCVSRSRICVSCGLQFARNNQTQHKQEVPCVFCS